MNTDLSKLMQQLQDPDPNVREAALDQLGTLKPENVLSFILPLLTDPDAEVRETAACNLGEIQDERAIPALLHVAAHDPDEGVRYHALAALANYQHPTILPLLLAEVQREKRSRRPRQAVAAQLGRYDSDESIQALRTLLADPDPYVVIPAVDSLVALNRPALAPLWRDIIATTYHPYICVVAAQALAQLEQQNVVALLLALLERGHDPVLRRGAMFTLTQFDTPEVLPRVLECARHDPDAEVRELALLGLAHWQHPEIYQLLLDLLSSATVSMRTLELSAEQLASYPTEAAVDALLKLLAVPNEAVRATAATALHALNRPRLAAVWTTLLEADEAPIRRLAREALEALAKP